MSAETLWNSYISKYNKWEDLEHVVKMKANGLKNMIQQAYEDGRAQGYKVGCELGKNINPIMDLFNGLKPK